MPSASHDPDFEENDDQPQKLSQLQLSDLIRDLDLSQEKAELLGSTYGQEQQGGHVPANRYHFGPKL